MTDCIGCSVTQILTVLVIACTIGYFHFKSKHNFWKKLGVKGPPPTFFLGNTFQSMAKSSLQKVQENYEKYGHIYGFYNMTTPHLAVSDPELVRKILIQDFSSFTNRRSLGFDHPYEKQMVFVLKDDKWRKWRQLFTKGFTASRMKDIADTLNKNAVATINKMDKQSNEVDIKDLGKYYSLPNIFNYSIGLDFNEQPAIGQQIRDSIQDMFTIGNVALMKNYLLPSWIKTWIRFSIFNGKVLDQIGEIVHEVVERRITTKAKRNDFLQLSLEAVNGMDGVDETTMDHLKANTIIFIAAGHETTATTVALACYTCAYFPDLQTKLYESVKSVVKDPNNITYDQIKEMSYLRAFIDETLRIYPPSTMTERETSCEYNLNGIVLPKDQLIYIPTYFIHHNPDNWDDPETFDPTRFLPENKDKIKPGTYLPFGDGPRNCPGYRFALFQTQIMLAHIIIRYTISTTSKTPSYPLDVSKTKDEPLEYPDLVLSFNKRAID